MEKVLNYFKENLNKKVIAKEIDVFGWQSNYKHLLIGSVSKFLFEDLEITENLAPLTNENREGIIKPKFYITVHDTGDSNPEHDAKFWSDTVKNEDWELGKYGASYQYVVDSKGIYHNIPDNEIAWHAGDSTVYDYALYETGVTGNNEIPIVDIDENGYYTIDGKVTTIVAPRAKRVKNGETIYDRLATKDDFNKFGILCKLINGVYYIGETYYNSGYGKICNRGGNNNSIGIESCVNGGNDIYHTWQKTAKLVAYLIDQNNLTIEDVKPHHYFSGKMCPQTIIVNGFWNHFIDLVKFEYDVLKFKKEGYQIEFICNDSRVLSNGRIVLDETKENIEYEIRIIKDGKEEIIKDFISF